MKTIKFKIKSEERKLKEQNKAYCFSIKKAHVLKKEVKRLLNDFDNCETLDLFKEKTDFFSIKQESLL